MEEQGRSLPTQTSLTPVYLEIDPHHWGRLTPIVISPGVMFIKMELHFPSSDGTLDGIPCKQWQLETRMSEAYSEMTRLAACGHWLLLNHTILDWPACQSSEMIEAGSLL